MGKLLYLIVIRLIVFVQCLNQYLQTPKNYHLEGAYRIIRYTENQHGLGILLLSVDNNDIVSFCHSNCGSFLENRRPFSKYSIKLGDSLISWTV